MATSTASPADFLAGIVLSTVAAQQAAMRQTVAPLNTMSEDMAERLQQGHRLTGKRIGGHLCIVATPK